MLPHAREQAAAPARLGGVSPDLADRLRELADVPSPEEALEPALQIILQATGAGAGAICLYDQRQELMRLAAESGLSDEGCRRLRCVRRTDGASWDMPLHGMLNRRAYLIDSASTNRYVPPLVEPPGSVRTIACLPLYAGAVALGSLILVALAPRVFTERDVRSLDQPLRELARMIEALRRRAPVAHPAPPPAAAPPPPRRPSAPLPAAVAAAPPAPTDAAAPAPPVAASPLAAPANAERIDLLIASLAATERERARLASALEAAAAERAAEAELRATLDEARAAQQAAAGELEALRARLDAAEAALGAERDRAGQWERRHAELAEELRAAGTQAEHAQAELRATLERSASERVAALEAALAAARTAAAARDAAAAADRERAEEWERRYATLAGELQDALARAERAEARLEAVASENNVAQLRELQQTLAQAQAAEEARVAAVEETAALRTALADAEARAEAAAAEVRHAQEELARLREAEAAAGAERTRLAAELAVARAGAAGVAIVPPAAAPVEIAVAPVDVAPPEQPAAPPDPPASGPQVDPGVEVVVVDSDPGWIESAPSGVRLAVVAPAPDLGPRLATAPAARIVANLAAPEALAALAALRAAGSRASVWGVLRLPGATTALPLGLVEAGTRPLDPDAVVAALGGQTARGTRVVTVGSDVDALISLRQAMARQGMSVSMAWDGKQAADLLAMVRPGVVVVDLEAPREGCAIVAGLAAADPVPSLVLVPGRADADGFAAALADPAHRPRLLRLDRLLAEVIRRADAARATEKR